MKIKWKLLPFSKWLILMSIITAKKHRTQKHKNTNDRQLCDKLPIKIHNLLYIKFNETRF